MARVGTKRVIYYKYIYFFNIYKKKKLNFSQTTMLAIILAFRWTSSEPDKPAAQVAQLLKDIYGTTRCTYCQMQLRRNACNSNSQSGK